jgi:hypothetical protein
MPDSRSNGRRSPLLALWRLLSPKLRIIGRICIVGGVLTAAWCGFVWFVGEPPIEATPALIMIWASVVLLLLALFPNVIAGIKRVKFGDYEVEFRDSISEVSAREFISPADLEGELPFADKRDFGSLRSLLQQADLQPGIPTLLVVNVREQDNRHISVSMLFTYLFFLDMFSLSTVVLFVDQRGPLDRLSDIERGAVIGASSGKKILWVFYRRFPTLLDLFRCQGYASAEPPVDHGPSRAPSQVLIESLSSRARQRLQGACEEERNRSDRADYLSARDVAMWFRGFLSTKSIDASLSKDDVKVVRSAIEADDEFVLLYKDGRVKNVVVLCELASTLTGRLLAKSG